MRHSTILVSVVRDSPNDLQLSIRNSWVLLSIIQINDHNDQCCKTTIIRSSIHPSIHPCPSTFSECWRILLFTNPRFLSPSSQSAGRPLKYTRLPVRTKLPRLVAIFFNTQVLLLLSAMVVFMWLVIIIATTAPRRFAPLTNLNTQMFRFCSEARRSCSSTKARQSLR